MVMTGAAITAETVRRHVLTLAGEIGERNVGRPAALADAADYIEASWRDQGYEVERQNYEVDGVTCANLIVERIGRARPETMLVIGAHYDTVPGSPGADDNASGVAALLEISRRFADLQPGLSVRFIAFVNEEPPYFMTRRQGSMVYATAARGRGDDIRLMVSLEMLGFFSDAPGSQRYPPLFRWFYPDRGNFLGFVSNLRSRATMRRAARVFRRESDFPLEHLATLALIPGVSWSDHRSFWWRGYPAFMATDTAFYRNPHYHQPTDTPDKLAYPEMALATDGLLRTFAVLADEIDRPADVMPPS